MKTSLFFSKLLLLLRFYSRRRICRRNIFRGLSRITELVPALLIHRIDPTLIEEYQEDDVVSETTYPIHRRHLNHESEHIVDEGVEEFISQHAPRQMSHRFQFVVDEQLRSHHDKTEGQEVTVEQSQDEGIPPFVLQI